jgi:hypothetical protein
MPLQKDASVIFMNFHGRTVCTFQYPISVVYSENSAISGGFFFRFYSGIFKRNQSKITFLNQFKIFTDFKPELCLRNLNQNIMSARFNWTTVHPAAYKAGIGMETSLQNSF